MIKGKTRTGFEYQIEDTAPDNMELIDAIADSGDDPTCEQKMEEFHLKLQCQKYKICSMEKMKKTLNPRRYA